MKEQLEDGADKGNINIAKNFPPVGNRRAADDTVSCIHVESGTVNKCSMEIFRKKLILYFFIRSILVETYG